MTAIQNIIGTFAKRARAASGPIVVERVGADGRLVSRRAPVNIWALPQADLPLPDDTVLYIPPRYPMMRFRFTFVKCADHTYRAYIREQPHYRRRPSDRVTTHRLQDASNRDFVCWSPAPRDAVAILKVARLWADRTARYVATGVRLEAPWASGPRILLLLL